MTSETPSHESANSPESATEKPVKASWVVAILFWGLMLMAGGLYAAVALSPKLAVYLRLKDDHYQTQVKLVTLERRVMYLKKVMHAFEHDPDFAAEQARVELGVERPGEERIALDRSLHFTPDADFDPSVFKKSILPWYMPMIDVLAGDRKIRRGLLIAAALMSLFAFTFLQESQTSQLLACARGMKTGCLRAVSRYHRSPAGDSQETPPAFKSP